VRRRAEQTPPLVRAIDAWHHRDVDRCRQPTGNDRLIGLIDQVRLMDVARTAEQVCADAGRPSCP